MRVLHHFLIAVLLAVALYPFYSWRVLLVFVTGFLIDVDHLIFYFFQRQGCQGIVFRNLMGQINRAHGYFTGILHTERRYEVIGKLFWLHNLEVLLLLAFLMIYLKNSMFFILFAGLSVHYLSDIGFEYSTKRMFVRAPSIVWYFLKKW